MQTSLQWRVSLRAACQLRHCSVQSVLEGQQFLETGWHEAGFIRLPHDVNVCPDASGAVLLERPTPSWRSSSTVPMSMCGLRWTTSSRTKHRAKRLQQVSHVQTQRTVTEIRKALAKQEERLEDGAEPTQEASCNRPSWWKVVGDGPGGASPCWRQQLKR